ncbi:MAG: flagellar basal body P-ring protein FlgI [bacterium]|nr:flagellar basal body P-ring protein FlgI [bacterium]
MRWLTLPILGLLVLAAQPLPAAPLVRVKDLAVVEGVRSNPLVGYGLVVGLQGTGDGTQAAFTIQSLTNMLRRSGITVPQAAIRVRNVAAVMVTVDLQPFARPGQRLDVQVSSLGDAKSLQGGTLLMTPLLGPDGITYALAQGAVSIGGAFLGGGGGNSVQKNHPTSGRVPSGAVVERAISSRFDADSTIRLLLNEPDFATASRVSASINETLGPGASRAEDAVSIVIESPTELASDPVTLIARIQAMEVRPDVAARVIINEKTGTVVVGKDVRVSKVAVAHGNLSVEIRTVLEASQPLPRAGGDTVVLPQQEVYAEEEPDKILTLEDGVTVRELVDSLNMLGVSARDMIAILQAMRSAGALHAEIVPL